MTFLAGVILKHETKKSTRLFNDHFFLIIGFTNLVMNLYVTRLMSHVFMIIFCCFVCLLLSIEHLSWCFFFFSFSHFDHIELHIQTESKLVREIFGLCYTTIPQQLENENILDSANGATATDWKGKMRKSAIGRAGPAAGPESWDGKLARTGGVLVWPEACRNGEPRLNRPIIERVKGWRGSSSGFCGPEPVTYRYTDNDVWRSGWNRRSFVVDTLKCCRIFTENTRNEFFAEIENRAVSVVLHATVFLWPLSSLTPSILARSSVRPSCHACIMVPRYGVIWMFLMALIKLKLFKRLRVIQLG